MSAPPRTHAVPLLALLVLAACGGASGGAEPKPVSRVFLLSCDTLRADRLGFYGYERDVSPNLDAFAAQSVVYGEAYACAPMTQPAVSSLLSGRLPTEVGTVPGNRRLMPPQVETLADAIQAAGIETAAVVSNYVLRKNQQQPGYGVSQGFAFFDDRMPDREVNRGLRERTAKRTTNAAIRWLEEHLAAGGERCFLWVHYQDPHGPYTPPPEEAERFDLEVADDGERVPIGKSKLGHGQIPGYQVLHDWDQPDRYRGRYDGEIRHFDEEIGRLIDWMDERGLLDDALVVFTSDHGEALGEHDYWFCHGESVHREIVRVPFFVRAPEGFELAGGAPGETSSLAVSHLDVYPTVLDALGLAQRPGLAGHSLLRGAPEGPRYLAQILMPSEDRTKWFGVSDGRYRLLWNEADDAHRLYDIQADPREERDLAAEQPERVARMSEALQRALTRKSGVEGQEAILDASDEEALRALGYGGDSGGDSDD